MNSQPTFDRQPHDRIDHLAALSGAGVIAVLRCASAQQAVRAVEALHAGGVTGIEITFSTPGAAEAIDALARRYGDELYLGAGTVLTEDQARSSVDAGARFLVSPGTDPELAPTMLATGAAVYLGSLTPSEVMQAIRLGAHAIKIFPASLGGPDYLRALRGPFPHTPLMPTGGVRFDNVGAWLAAGAVAVGAGGDLCSAALMNSGRWDTVEANARVYASALAAARPTEDSR